MGMKSKKFARKSADRPKKRPKTAFQQMEIQTGALARYNQIEHKAVTLNSVLTLPSGDTTWSVVQLVNGITQGVQSTQRIGRKVVLTSIQVRWLYEAALAATTEFWAPWRWCLVYDSSPDGVLPSPALIFDDNSFLGNVNLNSSERFLILHDEIIGKPVDNLRVSVTNGNSGYAGKFYKKLNYQQHFSATLGTIADIQKGAIYIMFCNSAAATGTTWSFYFNSRVRFTDA